MGTLDWKIAEERLNSMLSGMSNVDVYFLVNIVAPLKTRLINGNRSLRLYNEIMNIRMHYLKTMAAELNDKTRG